MAPFQDEDDFSILRLQIGSTFRRDGSAFFEVVAIDAVDHLVTCKSVDREEWHIFYNYCGRHPVYENIRMNDVDMIIHPNTGPAPIFNVPTISDLAIRRYNSIIIYDVAFGSSLDALPRDTIMDTRLGEPMIYNFYEHADTIPELVDDTAFLRVGYSFTITAEDNVPYTITAVDGDPVHTIECTAPSGNTHVFRVKSYGKEGAELLQLRDIVELIE